MRGRLGIRLVSVIIFLCSLALFISGCILQRQTIRTMEKVYATRETPHPLLLQFPQRDNHQIQLSSQQSIRIEQDEGQDLEKVAHVQIVKNHDRVCNAVTILADLERLGSTADRILFYPGSWGMEFEAAPIPAPVVVEDEPKPSTKAERKALRKKARLALASLRNHDVPTPTAAPRTKPATKVGKSKAVYDPHYETAKRLLQEAQDKHSVRLIPIPSTEEADFTPFNLFNLTTYSRILYLDSTALVLKNLDRVLRYTPPTSLAATRAYWNETNASLSPNFLLIQPSEAETKRTWTREKGFSFIEQLNSLYAHTAMILPQTPYELHTSEFRSNDLAHNTYLGTFSAWNAISALSSAYYVQFDDDVEPWKSQTGSRAMENTPKCTSPAGNRPCADRDVWRGLYERFADRRMDVCGLDLEPVGA